MNNQHTRGIMTTRHRSLVERGGRKTVLPNLQQGRPCHPTVLRMIISLPFHPQLIHALVAPSITNAFDFVMRNPVVTP